MGFLCVCVNQQVNSKMYFKRWRDNTQDNCEEHNLKAGKLTCWKPTATKASMALKPRCRPVGQSRELKAESHTYRHLLYDTGDSSEQWGETVFAIIGQSQLDIHNRKKKIQKCQAPTSQHTHGQFQGHYRSRWKRNGDASRRYRKRKLSRACFIKDFLKWTSKIDILDHIKIRNLSSPKTLQESEKKEPRRGNACILEHMYLTKDTYPEYIKNYKSTGGKRMRDLKGHFTKRTHKRLIIP